MRRYLALLAVTAVLVILWARVPYVGRPQFREDLHHGFAWAALITFLVATGYGMVHGPAIRAMTLAIWALLLIAYGLFVPGTFGGFGQPRTPSPAVISLAGGVAYLILAIEEAVRASLNGVAAWRQRAAQRPRSDLATE